MSERRTDGRERDRDLRERDRDLREREQAPRERDRNTHEQDPDDHPIRDAVDRSRHGAPAAGQALRDRFSTDEIFQRVTASAAEDIQRGVAVLFFSGLAAGTSVAASFFGRALLTAAYPEDAVGMGNLLYPVGFVIIVLGGYQLFTENTLTPVTLVLTRLASIPSLVRLWSVVLVANLIGAAVPAFIFANTGILDPAIAEAGRSFGEHALSVPWWDLFFKGILAGGLVATMVWLVHAARETTARFLIVYAIMFMIPAGGIFHCVVGAFEMLYLVFEGAAGLSTAFWDFFVPVLLGNTVGGVVFVTLVNYGMTEEHRFPDKQEQLPELSWWEWVLGRTVVRHLRNRNRRRAQEE